MVTFPFGSLPMTIYIIKTDLVPCNTQYGLNSHLFAASTYRYIEKEAIVNLRD